MTLVARSQDLSKLVEEGYDIEIRDANLLVHHVPYVNSEGAVARCILVSELSTNAEQAIEPGRHEVWVVGGVPHDHQGKKISIIADENQLDYGGGLVACCRLSGKPNGKMPRDYHHKMSNYVDILGRYARAIDSSATHTDYPPRERSEVESIFRYHDGASSRAALSAVTAKLKLGKVAIVGLGGTGSYILDLIAKTPINELHLYDDDVLYAHNAYRSPGAASYDEVKQSPLKVAYYAAKYAAFRRNIIEHPSKVTGDNIGELRDMNFVFLSMDAGPTKQVIVEKLEEWGTSFVDSGMGVERVGNSLRGTLRVTTGVKGRYGHLARRLSYVDVNANEYDLNIQTADLNMLNAAMAVIKWKKICGYYVDRKGEANSSYILARNIIHNGEIPE